jgi:glucose-6-phosphate 1-dehydrogenase
MKSSLRIYIFGASGDLAKKKIFPALFELFSRGLLPENIEFVGYARTAMNNDEFRKILVEFLTCRYVPGESCQMYMDNFLKKCVYKHGLYNSESIDEVFSLEKRFDNNIFYMALPPRTYLEVVGAIAGAEVFEYCKNDLKIVLEKPFGHSLASSEELQQSLSQYFEEEQFYRIDHYLGKELVQNILALRFANIIFEPVWNSKYIESVDIIWKETLSLQGRAGYFDKYGIIRDVIQNHLTQILALVSMEPVKGIDTDSIAKSKLMVLEAVEELKAADALVGQYSGNGLVPGYLEEDGVPENSKTPTFARIKLNINNERWKGVPFTITAGKSLDSTVIKVVLNLKSASFAFCENCDCKRHSNQLVIEIQPDAQIYLEICNKTPGEGFKLAKQKLNLLYSSAYREDIPDAYASLILDVIKGDKHMFVGIDELQASWRIFDEYLALSENESSQSPIKYMFGVNEESITKV